MYFNSIALTSILAATALGAAVPVDLVDRAGDLRGFDVSQAQAPSNPNFWKCAHDAGYGKAVIRGYRQACSTVSTSWKRCVQYRLKW